MNPRTGVDLRQAREVRQTLCSIMLQKSALAGTALLLLLLPISAEAGRDDTEDVIHAFFAAIDAGRIEDALTMLDLQLVREAGMVEEWTAQLSALTAVRVVQIGPAQPIEGGPCRTHRVTLDVKVTPDAANAPIPYYGWDAGPNVRWMELCPTADTSWAIHAIGTGP